ncbi:hypothetical protein M7I_8086 [Glarea lozoyensis 74030]|uniref:Uncharacterized protein n=1 Tax=Glarea lozoyensis (strain ATCC 74030 / MF5533) TaxID=1104152 RepID=H0EZ24_GLAL7|nr:hypothetical protein M7I_8086 [Glarea lozoyensis 74030]
MLDCEQYACDALCATFDWSPSAIISINGQIPVDYLLGTAQDTDTQYSDPDAIYNKIFTTIFGDGSFTSDIHNLGFSQDQTIFVFTNGTTISIDNKATSTAFANVDSGSALFNKIDLPAPGGPTAESPDAAPLAISELAGFPEALSKSPDGTTAAYILPDSNVGVLSFSAMDNEDDSQTQVINDLLDACEIAGCTKLIIDLQHNGGGKVFAGMSAFQQLFPGTTPLLAQRYRDTPMGEYLGKVWTTVSQLDPSNIEKAHMYDALSAVNENGESFSNYTEFITPQTIWGDNFTAITRRHFNPITPSRTERMFASEDMVILFDGSCGSTCTIFAQALKSQGGVRSVAVGGRPQTGPMQGVAGSEGSWVLGYGALKAEISELPTAEALFKANDLEFPSIEDVPSQYRIVTIDPPLGKSLDTRGRVNIPTGRYLRWD